MPPFLIKIFSQLTFQAGNAGLRGPTTWPEYNKITIAKNNWRNM